MLRNIPGAHDYLSSLLPSPGVDVEGLLGKYQWVSQLRAISKDSVLFSLQLIRKVVSTTIERISHIILNNFCKYLLLERL